MVERRLKMLEHVHHFEVALAAELCRRKGAR
jgi:hypothetical protein